MLEAVGSILRDYSKQYGILLNDGIHPPVRTGLLQPFIEERGVVDRINLLEAHIDTKYIVSQVQKFPGETGGYSGMLNVANIYYAENHNKCWRRFGVCKEMFHCMIDRTDAVRVSNLQDLKTLLELLSADTTVITGDFAPLDSEHEAELLALETLFPVEFRQKYLEQPISEPEEYMKVAEQFKIPVEYAQIACQPNYIKTITQKRGRLVRFSED